ncbi:MAG: putative pre6S rRNA nuclease [Patescibacteria group bacterium]|nr:putative pre6S rRNA nuclease [Patescibacteria group bacterium]
MGIDYGSKRVGIALSDELHTLAFPHLVIENTQTLVSDVIRLCKDNDVGLVVVGESKNFKQEENDIMKDIKPFVEEIRKQSGGEVVLHPEFLTSQQAERLQGTHAMLDASAAAIILQSYIDTHKK